MIENERLLTISVAAYNVESYIAEALASCAAIEGRYTSRLEVIVVNDGSNDATSVIAHEFESQHPDIIRVVDKPNGGYGSTINCSLALARGKFFRCLDGDDWFDPNALNRLLETLDGLDSDVVYTPFVHYYESGGREELVDCLSGYTEGVYPLDDITDGSFVALTYLTFKTDLLRRINLRITERCFYTDCEYAFLPFQIVQSIYVTHFALYRYRIGRSGQSISIESLSAHYQDNLRVCAGIVKALADKPAYQNGCLQDALAALCTTPYSVVFKIAAKKERKDALVEFDELLRSYPNLYSAIGRKSKKVRIARMTGFSVYSMLCLISMWGR